MKIKGIIAEDFVNFKLPCMTIMMPYCNMKCNKECGEPVCQNSDLASAEIIDIKMKDIINSYLQNDITKAICFQGMEPFYDYEDNLKHFIPYFRFYSQDPIIIYTGYTEEELKDILENLKLYQNIIIKFGRFKPNHQPHFDNVLGVNLASDNQYAKKIS